MDCFKLSHVRRQSEALDLTIGTIERENKFEGPGIGVPQGQRLSFSLVLETESKVKAFLFQNWHFIPCSICL